MSNLSGNSIHVRDENNKNIQSFTKDDFSYKKKDKNHMIIESDWINHISNQGQLYLLGFPDQNMF